MYVKCTYWTGFDFSFCSLWLCGFRRLWLNRFCLRSGSEWTPFSTILIILFNELVLFTTASLTISAIYVIHIKKKNSDFRKIKSIYIGLVHDFQTWAEKSNKIAYSIICIFFPLRLSCLSLWLMSTTQQSNAPRIQLSSNMHIIWVVTLSLLQTTSIIQQARRVYKTTRIALSA